MVAVIFEHPQGPPCPTCKNATVEVPAPPEDPHELEEWAAVYAFALDVENKAEPGYYCESRCPEFGTKVI